MKDPVIIAAVVILAVVGLASGLVFSGVLNRGGETTIESVTIATDKDVYHSKDRMNITVDVSASGPADGVLLRVEGIEDYYGRLRLFQERNVTLQAGRNSFVVDYTLPVCSVCAGLYSGEYAINATLTRDGVVLASSTRTITIE
ncbi:MAG: hypothetical protein QMD46_06200 [Methanomicrobiales archaeon]|nr:hypothetical protein [Methanomicrobiales archaeon]MDI6876141.1 hypothetical protein [Methanomicrobiales archaeon]